MRIPHLQLSHEALRAVIEEFVTRDGTDNTSVEPRIKQVLRQLEIGSVVTMRRSAGENIDILIGGVVIAFGEIVIIENTMGVRITDFNTEV